MAELPCSRACNQVIQHEPLQITVRGTGAAHRLVLPLHLLLPTCCIYIGHDRVTEILCPMCWCMHIWVLMLGCVAGASSRQQSFPGSMTPAQSIPSGFQQQHGQQPSGSMSGSYQQGQPQQGVYGSQGQYNSYAQYGQQAMAQRAASSGATKQVGRMAHC